MMNLVTQDNFNTPNWISIIDACKILNLREKTLKNRCYNGQLNYKIERKNNRNQYFIRFDSLNQYSKKFVLGNSDTEIQTYSDAPEWAKVQADKYITILKTSNNLHGLELHNFINNWNKENPNTPTSYPSVLRMRHRYAKEGISGLLAKYGNNGARTTVADDHYDYFKNLYLKEGAPSAKSCWLITLGYAMKADSVNKSEFPSYMSFLRRLQREIPEQAIYLARKGESAWNRKYGKYIERDYSNITCGKVWVSDHAQIDVACMSDDGRVVFPWVTAWRDYKSGKWLGWILQCGHPNSDLIFQSFYYAAEEYGLPEDVIIDNGKDYRSKDFAGGRKKIKIDTHRAKTTSMLDELNVNVNFALPYNAQTKPIERDFKKIKESLCVHLKGYRGGNIVERPEKLANEINEGKILPFEKFKAIFDDFIINAFNKMPSNGKNHNGLSPNELFNQEFKEKITTSSEALKLFCMRTSKDFTIGRNGIKDSQLGITYWADWMMSHTGLKVYLRRDPQNYKEAWAFRADNEEFVGIVTAVRAVAALHAETVSKEEFKEAMATKKRNIKVAKAYIKQTREISAEEVCENYKTAFASVERSSKPKISKIANTNMDMAVRKNKEMQEFGKQDLSIFLRESIPDEPLYLFETDKLIDEARKARLKGVANGY